MLGFMKSAFKSSADSNTESSNTTATRTSSEPVLITSNNSKSSNSSYKNDFLDNQSVQQLQDYAVHKAEETTATVNNCLAIAVDIREDAVRTLETLHQQGDQIHRTHEMALNLDRDLTKGEKLLGSLGGMFSRTWKPKKARQITGPKITPENSSKPATKEQREKLGTAPLTKPQQAGKTSSAEPANCCQKIEMEKTKQDDALDDLSNILGDLKGMAFDMGTELNRQNKALDHLNDDIDEMNSRVKGAEQRARKLVGK